MYTLSVGALFKNESHSIKEWIMHYLHHGVDHFFLINDNSTDDFLPILQPYIDDGKITLFHVIEPYYLGRQRNLYNRYILPHIKETKWLLMVDIDEYVWSKKNVNISHVLLTEFEGLGQIQLRESLFGSNGHITQPRTIVNSFTKRCREHRTGKYKYFLHSAYEFSSLNIHHADFANAEYIQDFSKFIVVFPEYFIMNHYNCQSREFWDTVKCTRGDSDHYVTRLPEHFALYDINEIDDFELVEQNKSIDI
jgi:hypothetical protein